MSNAYRLHGTRYLRKYTAAERSSIYSYMTDVRTIANSLCTVPWTRVGRDLPATTTIHTEEGIDWNEPERDRFDAAEWCGEHADGFHRAFAQAACYVFRLPDSAVGTAIEKVRVNVTSDPYNPYGARIAALTSETLDIPMDCETVRNGDMHRAPDENGLGAAPRLFMRNANGTQTWYANTELVELAPEEGETLEAKKYLFVFVCLENYNRGREGWIEGSSYIENDVELTLAEPCDDLDDVELNNLPEPVELASMAILKSGILPYIPTGSQTGERKITVRTDANLVIEPDGSQTPLRPAAGETAASSIGRLYSAFYSGDGELPTTTSTSQTAGASFNVTRLTEQHASDASDRPVDTDVLRIDSSALVVPFVYPVDFVPAKLLLSTQQTLNLPAGARYNVFISGDYLTSLTAEQLKNPGLYDGNGSPFTLIGTIDAHTSLTSQAFDLPTSHGRVGSIIITGYFPPDRYDLVTGGRQGTGSTPYIPDISITE